MYKIDKNDDFNFLIGKELVQLCIGLYQLILNFSDGLVICTECSLHLESPNGSIIKISSDSPELTCTLHCLLGKTIEFIRTSSKDKLILKFSDGYWLSFIDNNENQESFTITMGEHEIIV